jgi:hypothetical protein
MGNKHKKFAGRGMHEIYLPTTGKGKTERRTRKNCCYYNGETGWCRKIFNTCVGPSICRKYKDISQNKDNRETLLNKVVYSKYLGKGIVVSVSTDICTIQYEERKVQIKRKDLENLIADNKQTT